MIKLNPKNQHVCQLSRNTIMHSEMCTAAQGFYAKKKRGRLIVYYGFFSLLNDVYNAVMQMLIKIMHGSRKFFHGRGGGVRRLFEIQKFPGGGIFVCN